MPGVFVCKNMTVKKKHPPCFWIYMLECENGSYYTGYTKNLAMRYQQHLNGKVKYTHSFRPVRIAQCWQLFDEVGMALKIERFIKKQDRRVKELLVHSPEELARIVQKELHLQLRMQPCDLSKIMVTD